jgi:hypothetical protein
LDGHDGFCRWISDNACIGHTRIRLSWFLSHL